MSFDIEFIRESWDYEFKLAGGQDGKGELPKDFWKTYSAMANSLGGIVVLGLRELPDYKFEVVGIKNIEKVERELWNNLNNLQKVSHCLLTQTSVTRESIDGKNLLVIKIPRASRSERPVYLNGNPMTGTFIRRNEGDYPCSPEQVKRMIADADIEHTRDAQVLDGYSIKDLATDSLKAYRNLFRTHNPEHPFLKEDEEEFLTKLGVLSRTNKSLTVAGLLVFGKDEAILSYLPHFFLDYREIPSGPELAKGTRWIDRVCPDGTWSGNLFEFYQKVLPKLTSNLKIPFQLNADLLRVNETPVHKALKEALMNALIHGDHTGRTGVRIFKYPDHFEFYNFGNPLLPLDLILKGGKSECRNPLIQKIFRMIGIGEQAGSGFPSILHAWQEQHWRMPLFDELLESNETLLTLRMLSLFPEGVIETLRTHFKEKFDQLSEDERLILATAEAEGTVANRRIQELSNTHGRDITFLLRKLVDEKFLEAHGNKQGRTYTVFYERSSVHSADVSSVHKDSESRESLNNQQVSSVHKDLSSVHKDGIPLWEQVKNSKRANPQLVQSAILAFCDSGEKTLEQIAEAIGREKETIRIHYLKDLIDSKLLELHYPDRPQHPHQAYKRKN